MKSLTGNFTERSGIESAFDASRHYSEQDFRQTLENGGWQVRPGDKNNILISPDNLWVVKLFHPRKNAAEAEFARYAAEHPAARTNPHIVRTEHVGELKDGAFSVMERLDPLRVTTRQNAQALHHMNGLLSPDNFHTEYEQQQQAIDYLAENNPEMLDAARHALQHAIWLSRKAPVLQGLKPFGIATALDNHHDNVMMRTNAGQPETIVLIDLFQRRPWPSNMAMGTHLRQTLDLLNIDPERVKKEYQPYTQEYDGLA